MTRLKKSLRTLRKPEIWLLLLVVGLIGILSFTYVDKIFNNKEDSSELGQLHERMYWYNGDIELDELISKNEKVMLEFRADWCPYCKDLEKRLPSYLDGREELSVIMVDIDNYSELADEFKVVATPTLYYFNNGEVIQKVVGALPNESLDKFLEIKN